MISLAEEARDAAEALRAGCPVAPWTLAGLLDRLAKAVDVVTYAPPSRPLFPDQAHYHAPEAPCNTGCPSTRAGRYVWQGNAVGHAAWEMLL